MQRERERERERERLKKTNALVVWTGTYIMVLPSARESDIWGLYSQ